MGEQVVYGFTYTRFILLGPPALRKRLVRLSIFWRIVLTSLLIIVVMGGVNLYALFQLRQLSALSTSMAVHHYPAIESA